MIEIKNLTKRFQSRVVLKDITINLPDNGLIIIEGENGSGKSTLLNILDGLDRDYEGSVKVSGVEIKDLKGKELNKYQHDTISYVFQKDNFITFLNKEENIELASFIDGKKVEKVKDSDSVESLSQGWQKVAMIQRALNKDASCYLFDEVTASLDDKRTSEFYEQIKTLGKNKLVILVTHDIRFIDLADAIFKLDKGSLTIIKELDVKENDNKTAKDVGNTEPAKLTLPLLAKSQKRLIGPSLVCFICLFAFMFFSYFASSAIYINPAPYLSSFIKSIEDRPKYIVFDSGKVNNNILMHYKENVYQSEVYDIFFEDKKDMFQHRQFFLVYTPIVDNDGMLHCSEEDYAYFFDNNLEEFNINFDCDTYVLKAIADEDVPRSYIYVNPSFTDIISPSIKNKSDAYILNKGYWDTDTHYASYYNIRAGINGYNRVLPLAFCTKSFYESTFHCSLPFEVERNTLYTSNPDLKTTGIAHFPKNLSRDYDVTFSDLNTYYPDGFYVQYFNAQANTKADYEYVIVADEVVKQLYEDDANITSAIAIDFSTNFNGLCNILGKNKYQISYLYFSPSIYNLDCDEKLLSYYEGVCSSGIPENISVHQKLLFIMPICASLLEICFAGLLVSMQIKNLRVLKSYGLSYMELFIIILLPVVLIGGLANLFGFILGNLYIAIAEIGTMPIPSYISTTIFLVTFAAFLLATFISYKLIKKYEKITF